MHDSLGEHNFLPTSLVTKFCGMCALHRDRLYSASPLHAQLIEMSRNSLNNPSGCIQFRKWGAQLSPTPIF